jgi:hypothetical protein
MNINFSLIHYARELPATWDHVAEIYFQKREFLVHAEKYNPCKQRYWLLKESGELKAGAVLYTLRLDMLTFMLLKSPLEMHIAGIPCSVSCSGFIGDKFHIQILQKHLFSVLKGFVLFLNLADEAQGIKHAHGNTLPAIIIKRCFPDWEDYISALRSDYRRRLLKLLNSNHDIILETLPCSEFSPEMYNQYLEVYKKSDAKLEKLTYDFFLNLPDLFRLTICRKGSEIIGWNITLFHEKVLYFFLGGINYQMNTDNSTYLLLLAHIVRRGIEIGAGEIDLGQTAEIPKMRMGGIPEKRFMEAHHNNLLMNNLIRICQGMLSYKRDLPEAHVFKEVLA